jgi:hypothetical protein
VEIVQQVLDDESTDAGVVAALQELVEVVGVADAGIATEEQSWPVFSEPDRPGFNTRVLLRQKIWL